jgi:tetratricopeptide (TPR) repeat protein
MIRILNLIRISDSRVDNAGQVKEAVLLLEQIVTIKEQTLAEDHPNRLASQHELAGAYQANGEVKEAVSLLEQVVQIQEQTLTEDHPDRLTSQHELAVMLAVQIANRANISSYSTVLNVLK